MIDFYEFPCGCKFEVIGPPLHAKSKIPALKLDWDNIPLDCPAAYSLLASGRTKCVFQLEKGGGRSGCKELKPENIDHTSALGALLRPGCASNVDEKGISTTKHFYLRKNGEEQTQSYHPVIDKILEPTYFCLIYQETAMKIAEIIAGFTKQEADTLRKAIGKKIAQEMAKVEKLFLKKAAEVGILNENQAKEVFGWIKESQRYSFNAAHAYSYGITSYQCAYSKAHFAVETYTSWLIYGQEKGGKPTDEYAELVDDAKVMGIDILPPDITDLKIKFYHDGELIKYGISNIKEIGVKTANKMIKSIKTIENDIGKKIKDWSWYEFLVLASSFVGKTGMENLILSGAFSKFGISRSQMFTEYEAFSDIKDGELVWVKNNYSKFTNLIDLMEAAAHPKKESGACSTKGRVEKLKSRLALLRKPIVSYEDKPVDIAMNEERLLGIAITCSVSDGRPGEKWNATCRDCVDGNLPKNIILKVKIDEVRENTIKKGKEENIGKVMGYLKVSDGTCSLSDISCFPEAYEKHKHLLTQGRVLEIQLEKSYKGNRLHIKDVFSI